MSIDIFGQNRRYIKMFVLTGCSIHTFIYRDYIAANGKPQFRPSVSVDDLKWVGHPFIYKHQHQHLSFPIIHKVGNVDNFVLPKFANK